jgi:hypothetical protein
VRNSNENNNNKFAFTGQNVEEVEVTPDFGNMLWYRSKQELGFPLDG